MTLFRFSGRNKTESMRHCLTSHIGFKITVLAQRIPLQVATHDSDIPRGKQTKIIKTLETFFPKTLYSLDSKPNF